MSLIPTISDPSSLTTVSDTSNALDLLSKNTLTTLGVVTGAGTAVAAGALVTAALPAQMLTATAVSAGLIYAGDRQAKGLSINPFAKQEGEAKSESKTVNQIEEEDEALAKALA